MFGTARGLPFDGDARLATLFWLVFAGFVLSEIFIGTRRRADAKSVDVQDRGSHRFLVILISVGLFAVFQCAYSVPAAALTVARVPVCLAGIALMLAGITLRAYAIAVLGRFFTTSVATQAGQVVVDTGPYRWVRHPSYSGSLLTFLGIGLALGNWLGFALLMACTVTGFYRRMLVEEAVLATALGEPYRLYMSRTKRLVPSIL